ncbi:ABC transporter ATP-binding protein [Flaviaesturariibacter flavus]|uniref:ABC transporter ATP-binding protein n=1 Tax=Flaviaesturariibacter flavus TaxID=2502780 RepID=A0A4V2NWZ8_9BACT|nr:ABC transporter ATP-binding protein [Flaviaesturariibacter flavus]TCJ19312.1 ABC transporter ATP-binding protein [Flaviaesturariibacter flavus]
MKHLRHLGKYFYKYRLRLAAGIFFILISNYFGVLAPQVTGFIIEYVQSALGHKAAHKVAAGAGYDVLVMRFIRYVEGARFTVSGAVTLAGITILALALLRGLFMFFMRQTIIVMSRHIEYDQKNEVYAHYQRLDAGFYKTHSVGDLMSRMAEDVSRVRMFTGPAIMYLTNLTALIAMTVFFMWKRSPELTLYVLAPLPLLALTIYRVNTVIHRRSEALQATLAALTTNAQQSYSGIRVIKSFVQERAMLGAFEDNSEKYRRDATTLAKIESLYFPSMALFIGISTLLTIMIGGLAVIRGMIDLATIVEFVIYINMLTFPVSAIGWTASMIQRAAASQKRLNEFLHAVPLVRDAPDAEDMPISGAISFRGVDFVYPNTGIRALSNLTLDILPGQKVAVVGRTGSGKSTLVQLLLRLYDPTAGTVLLDGSDIRRIRLESLRGQVSYVPQDGFLFSDTIARNIAFGADGAGQEAIEAAAAAAAVHRDISGFPAGYETVVGERGVTLSGGQKQRVSIARALVRETPVLLLDDSLSAVDTRTEREILNHIGTYLQGRTSILVTHKVLSLSGFDQIVVLESGRLAEKGTHDSLLAAGGIYAEMYRSQLAQDAGGSV